MFYCARNNYLLSFICLLFFVSCGDNPFRKSSTKMHSILKKSMKLYKVVEVKNLYDDEEKITGTLTKFDTSQAKEFLQGNESKILKHYEILKSYTEKPNEFYYDAIFILALFNELLEFTQPIEDRCIYVKMIPMGKKIILSEWVLDDILGSLTYGKHFKKEWLRMEYNEKYLYILHFLDSPTQNGRKCINLPGREKYTRFPPIDVSQ